MARIPTQVPYLTVVPSPKANPTYFRWTVYYAANGVPAEKQGRVSIARVAKQASLSPTKAARESERLAREAGSRAIEDILSGGGSTVWTVRTWCDHCVEKILAKECDLRYATQVKSQLDLHVHDVLGSVPLNKLTAEQILGWWEWLERTPRSVLIHNKKGEIIGRKKPKVLAWKTRDLVRGYLSTCLGRARQRGHVSWNPVDSIPSDRRARLAYKASRAERLQWLTLDELRLLLHGARRTALHTPVLIQMDLAVRSAEACGLWIQDVDPATGRVNVVRQLARKPEEFGGSSRLASDDPKGMKRPFRASEELRRIVRERISENALLPEQERQPYVALTADRRPMDSVGYSKQFRRLCTSLGIRLKAGNSTHVVRRSVLNLLKEAPGLTSETRSLIAGHADQETTNLYLEDELTMAQRSELASAADWLHGQLRE